jgi:Fe-S cluster assembly iron-binding protein IscA
VATEAGCAVIDGAFTVEDRLEDDDEVVVDDELSSLLPPPPPHPA